MKLAVLSDIHGNRPALEATAADIDAWKPDVVIVDGDIVNSGPDSVYCWRYIKERRECDGWVVLRGNHEDYVAEWTDPATPTSGPAYELIRLSHWTYRQLGYQAAVELAALPTEWSWTNAVGERLRIMHGSLPGNRTGIYPHTSDRDVRARIDPAAAVFATAHTHIPHVRTIDETLVVNVGSVGVPGDGDHRASYGRLTWTPTRGWDVTIARVVYDRAAAERAFFATGFLDEAGPEAEMSLVELRLARDVRTRWAAIYRQRILSGDIELGRAVREFLDLDEFRPYALHASGTLMPVP